MNEAGQPPQGVPRRQLFSYSIAELPMSMVATPVSLFLPAFYTQDLGLSMATVGFVLMLSKFWDVATDPVIGYLSDRTRTPFGRRKPWILAAVPLVMIATYMLFFPPADVNATFLLMWIMVLWFGWTLFNIPYFAWGAELSPDYTDRTRITGWRTIAGLAGTLTAIAIPATAQQFLGWGGRNDQTIFIIGVMGLCLIPVCVGVAGALVPERNHFVPAKRKILAGLKIMWANAPFRRLLVAFLMSSLAVSLTVPLFVLFITHIIGDPTAAPKFVLFHYAASLLGVPFWMWLARTTDKHVAWLCSILGIGLMFPQFMWLDQGDVTLALVLMVVIGFAAGNIHVVPASMKADVIDLDSVASGEDRAGLFFAAWSTVTKLVSALGVGISLPVLAWLGFDPTVQNTTEQLRAFQTYFSFAPVPFYLAAAWLVLGYPITRASHARIRAELDQRHGSGGAHPAAPLPGAAVVTGGAALTRSRITGGKTL
jgi:Na+/melibiose symporter-like transporter